MAFFRNKLALLWIALTVLAATVELSTAARKQPLAAASAPKQVISYSDVVYHDGAVLAGYIPVSVFWYGEFTSAQKSIISDFFVSLSSTGEQVSPPSVSQWWNKIDQFYLHKAVAAVNAGDQKKPLVLLGNQISEDKYSMGKKLTTAQVAELARKAGAKKNGIAVVLTAHDVIVDGFCSSRCASHGFDSKRGFAYIWVGDSATQCAGQCAWPFHQPLYGPQTPALVAPNGDVGADGIVINLASMLAGTVTNPSGDGFYQGPKEAALEAATACSGVYGKDAYPGFPGNLPVDPTSGGSFNAKGVNGRKYLLPALMDPSTSTCSTMV